MNIRVLLYTLLYCLLTPYILCRLWWKGRTLPAYRLRIPERFCVDDIKPQPVDIWVHAVSLGEVIAITPLIEMFLLKKKTVLVTTMTPTGANSVAKHFGARVIHRYVPYEYPFALRRFFKAFKPKVGILVETELWPNLIVYARQAGVRLMLFNARLSNKSCRNYSKISWFITPLLNQLHGIYTQTKKDAQRFKFLGADATRVHVAGNIKFDLQIKPVDWPRFEALKLSWGPNRVLVIVASTHEGEEQLFLNVLRQLQEKMPGVLLLIAPRHPERFAKIHQLAVKAGFNTGLRSDSASLNSQNEVVVLDSLGELLGFFQISDYAFMGGSFVPVGGHNMLEPIAMNVPVFTGSYVHNFQVICQKLLAVGGIIQVDTPQEWVQQLVLLHHDQRQKKHMQAAANKILQENKGALQRYLQITEEALALILAN